MPKASSRGRKGRRRSKQHGAGKKAAEGSSMSLPPLLDPQERRKKPPPLRIPGASPAQILRPKTPEIVLEDDLGAVDQLRERTDSLPVARPVRSNSGGLAPQRARSQSKNRRPVSRGSSSGSVTGDPSTPQGSAYQEFMIKMVAKLASYVPRLILQRFSVQNEPLTHPETRSFHGAILFLDISGFTSLSERYAQMGPGGIEELTSKLNDFFGSIIEVVYSHGGDVINFAGDALIVLFASPGRREIQRMQMKSITDPESFYELNEAISSKRRTPRDLSNGGPDSSPEKSTRMTTGATVTTTSSGSGGGGGGASEALTQRRLSAINETRSPAATGDLDETMSNSQTLGETAAPGPSPRSPGSAQPAPARKRSSTNSRRAGASRLKLSKLELAHTGSRAVQCGLDVIERVTKLKSTSGLKLSIHSAVAASKLHCMHVGGINGIWQLLLVGDSFRQLDTAVASSQPGQVVVAADTFPALKGHFEGNLTSSGDVLIIRTLKPMPSVPWPELDLSSDMVRALCSYIPVPVQRSVESLQEKYLSELRRVTVMFLNLSGLTVANNALPDHRKIHDVLCSLQRILYQYDGMIRQFLVDEKGTTFIGVFGVPPFAHEDDPARAVKAACDMFRQLSHMELSGTIGITTGQVFCGSVGSQTRQEYAMVGDVVNLSARLMKAAKKHEGILTDEETRNLAKDAVQFESRHSVYVKGKMFPINIYRPIAQESDSDVEKVTIVGRDAERRVLHTKIKVCANRGPARAVLVQGAPGSGKTALLRYARALAIDASLAGYYVSMDSGKVLGAEGKHVLSPWASAVASVIDISRGAELARRSLTALVGSKHEVLLSLFNDILPVAFVATKQSKRLSEKNRVHNLQVMIMHIFVSMESPLVLCIDDYHKLPDEALQLLLSIVKKRTQGILVCAGIIRPQDSELDEEAFMDRPRELQHTINSQFIKVGPMKVDESVALARYFLNKDGQPLTLDIESSVRTKGQGMPAVIESIVRPGVVLGQVIESDANNGSKTERTDAQRIISTSMAQLPAPQQLILKVASVIGHEFDLATLMDLFPVEVEARAFSAMVQELVRIEFLEQIDLNDANIDYERFPHLRNRVVTHRLPRAVLQVAYNHMLFSQRQELHFNVARWFERDIDEQGLDEEEAEQHYPVLVTHWQRALEGDTSKYRDQVTRPLQYAYTLGETRYLESNFESAIEYYITCLNFLSMLPHSATRHDFENTLRSRMRELFPEIMPRLKAWEESATSIDKFEKLFIVNWNLANGAENRADAVVFVQELERRAHEHIELFSRQRLQMQLHHAWWAVSFAHGDFMSTIKHCEAGIANYDAAVQDALSCVFGGHDCLSCCVGFHAISHWMLGNGKQALQKLNQLIIMTSKFNKNLSANDIVRGLCMTLFTNMLKREYGKVTTIGSQLLRYDHTADGAIWIQITELLIAASTLFSHRAPSQQALTDILNKIDGATMALDEFSDTVFHHHTLFLPMCYCMVAEALTIHLLTARARQMMDLAQTLVERHGIANYDSELLRVRAEIKIVQARALDPHQSGMDVYGNESSESMTKQLYREAEELFDQAADVARQQRSKALELRAVLAKCQYQMHRRIAMDPQPLWDVYESFEEGHDSADLVMVKQFLEQNGRLTLGLSTGSSLGGTKSRAELPRIPDGQSSARRSTGIVAIGNDSMGNLGADSLRLARSSEDDKLPTPRVEHATSSAAQLLGEDDDGDDSGGESGNNSDTPAGKGRGGGLGSRPSSRRAVRRSRSTSKAMTPGGAGSNTPGRFQKVARAVSLAAIAGKTRAKSMSRLPGLHRDSRGSLPKLPSAKHLKYEEKSPG